MAKPPAEECLGGLHAQGMALDGSDNTLCTVHYAQYTVHYALCTVHYALCTIHYALCTRTALDGPGNHGKRRLQCVGRELLPDPPESNIGQLLSQALWVKCRAGAEGKGSNRFIAGPSTYRAKFTELTSNRNSKCRGSL